MPISNDTVGALIGLKRKLLKMASDVGCNTRVSGDTQDHAGQDVDDVLEDCHNLADSISAMYGWMNNNPE